MMIERSQKIDGVSAPYKHCQGCGRNYVPVEEETKQLADLTNQEEIQNVN